MKQRKGRGHIGKRIASVFAVICTIFSVCVLILGVWIRKNFQTDLPSEFYSMAALGESPHFYVYDFEDRQNREGERKELSVGGLAQKKQTYVSYEEIPQSMIDAFVAIEDKRFFEHKGVDWYRTLAASGNYLFHGGTRFGASTITQQVVKNLTGKDEISPSRKLQEILYALDLEQSLDKTQILEIYLNIIHFSDHCNGIAEASEHYFSKTPSELSVAEMASIAAITNNPSYYNPIRHPENNLSRRNLILSEMLAQNYLSNEEYEKAVSEPLALCVSETSQSEGINSWYIDMVIEDVIDGLMKEHGLSREVASALFYKGGLHIELAMNPDVQRTVEDYYENAVQTPINENGERAQSALIVMDSRTGDILGVAGAIGKKTGNRVQNFATQTKRPPGSVIKPISVYAPALEEGIINWASVYDDVPVRFEKGGTKAWPRNANGVYRGLTNIPYAVAHSTNTVAVRVLEDVGLSRAFAYAKERFGLTSMVSGSRVSDCDVAALALGQLNYGVTLRELTAAYTVFADGGCRHPWRSFYRVLSSDGEILLANPDRSDVVISEGNAAIMTKLLQGVVESGTSSSITLNRYVECAGKTGTTNQENDRWFVGYTPDMICGVWCGYEYPEPLAGRNICTDIWNRVMSSLWEREGGRRQFSVPTSVFQASYCRDSGKLLTAACSLDARGDRVQQGWFLREQLPTDFCDCHVVCEYDEVCKGISHGFCPAENLKRVALIRVQRSFPMQVLVADAQYVWNGEPTKLSPNTDPSAPYFGNEKGVFRGISNTKTPFHASCGVHREKEENQSDWESLFPRAFWDEQE